MADYVSVLKSAIDGLAENTPEGRADLYDKAREALKRQLEALDTAMSDEQRASQLAALDEAVKEIEATFAADDTDALLQAGLKDALGSATEAPAKDTEDAATEEDTQDETDKPESEEEAVESDADAGTSTEIATTTEEPSEPEPEESVDDVKAEEDTAGEPEQPDDRAEDQEAVVTEKPDDEAETADGDEAPALDDVDQAVDADGPPMDEPTVEAAADDTGSADAGDAEQAVTGAALAASTRDRLKAAFGGVEERFPTAKPDEDDADPLSRVHSAVEEIEAFSERKEPQISEVIPFSAAKAAVSGDTATASEEHAPELEPEPITAPLPESEPHAELSPIRVEPIEIPGDRGSSNAWIIWLGVALVVAAGGAWGYMNRDTVMPVLQSLTEKARQMDEATLPAEAPKIDDRVPAADADGSETEVATAPDGGGEAGTETTAASADEDTQPETPTVAETDAGSGTENAAAAAQPAGSEAAILYEEGAGADGADLAHSGAVTWTVIREPIPNGPDQTVLQGQSSVAPNGVGFSVTIRKNTDETLPASHTIDLFFTVPADYAFGAITNIGGLLMKANEPERGDALIGAAAKVTDGFFIIGLSEAENDRTFNLDLLQSRGWFDIPLLFDSGKRGILTLAKGNTGTAAFIEAFASWDE